MTDLSSYFSKMELRDILLGVTIYNRCPVCESTGYQNWDAYGNDIKSGKTSDTIRTYGSCDNCDGLGFIYAGKESVYEQ